jgi:hypothetical protein
LSNNDESIEPLLRGALAGCKDLRDIFEVDALAGAFYRSFDVSVSEARIIRDHNFHLAFGLGRLARREGRRLAAFELDLALAGRPIRRLNNDLEGLILFDRTGNRLETRGYWLGALRLWRRCGRG